MASSSLTTVVLSLAVLVVVTPVAQSEGDTRDTSLAESNNMNESVGLDRIKPAVSSEQQNSPTDQVKEHTTPNEEMEHVETEVKVGSIHGDSGKADDENQKVTNHEGESRSNLSSTKSSEQLSSAQLHPLHVDRHQGAASRPVFSKPHSNGEVAHEHVIRYQIHQGSEEDSEEDAGFKAPTSDRVHAKLPASTVVSSNSFPVRLGLNVVRIPGSSNSNTDGMEKTSTIMKMKPIPVVRQEIPRPDITREDDSHLDQ